MSVETPGNPESFDRLIRMVGREGFERLRAARVLIVGLGAVGSYALEGLARSGVGQFTLVDFDEVQRSNINRNLLATESTVGKSKVEIAVARVMEINPQCQVEGRKVFAHEESLEEIYEPRPDLVIDAIDALGPKCALLAGAVRRGLMIISSMGAALRRDPSMVRVGSLFETRNCPLARQVRRRLRRAGLELNVTCVYSPEEVQGLPETAVSRPEDEDYLVRGRVRNTLGSLPTVTGIFGLTAANEAIRLLTAAERNG